MDYRDERDALRARVDSLESELVSARAETERMRATENALSAAQRENEKLKAELGRMAPRPKSGAGSVLAVVGVTAGVTVAGAVLVFVLGWRGRDIQPPPPVVAAPWTGATAGAIATSAEGPAPTAEPEKSPRVTTVEWPARVVKAQGLPYPTGTKCSVRATLRSDGLASQSPDVEIACGGKSLYRSTDQLEGMSNTRYNTEEAPGPETGSYRAALLFEDQGARTGERTQGSVNTFAQVAVAWKETAPAYRIELEVDELSSTWKGPGLFVRDEELTPMLRTVVERRGKAESVKDNPLVQQGASCIVRVRPAFGKEQNCRTTVKCGEATLYGGESGGFNMCVVEGGKLIGARDTQSSDKDHDPLLEMNLPQGTAVVSDAGDSPWRVSVHLDP